MSSGKKKRVSYSFGKGGFYMSVVTTVLSVFLALLLLRSAILLMYYAIVAFLMTAFIFALKIGLIFSYASKFWAFFTRRTVAPDQKEETVETSKEGTSWRASLLILAIIIAFLFLPLILAKFLNPYVWFILLISFISGISIADVCLYLYALK